MTAQNFARIDLDLIEPRFLKEVLDIIAKCNARGAYYFATLGYRTFAAQDALYAKGRTMPGPKVTAAKGGESAHCYGLAIDFTYDTDNVKPGLQPGWKTEQYRILREEVELAGLHSGAGYNDWPHVSVRGYVNKSDMQPLRVAWEKSTGDTLTRLKEVWQSASHGQPS